MATNYDDVSVFELSPEREEVLLTKQTECCLMWTTSAGDPVGVFMNFVWAKGSFWLTATRQRQRIKAYAKRPRGAIAITSRGTDIGTSQAVTYKGDIVLHEDPELKAWMYKELAARVRPESEDRQRAFVEHLDTPMRVVIELRPDARIGFDAEAMFKGSAAGPSRTQV
jgi:hypothetical protein